MQTLRPIEKPPRVYRMAAFDMEGDAKRGAICGAFAYGDKVEYYDGARVLERMTRRDVVRGLRVYAHNLGYDMGVLLPHLPPGTALYMINGDVYNAKVPISSNKRLNLWDSARLFAFLSLDSLGKTIGYEKLPTPPQLLTFPEDVEEWYCEDHHRLWCVECYVKRDAQVLVQCLELFQRTLNELGGQVRNTLASTAMDLFRRRFLNEEYYTPFPYRNEFARNAYYGGRVEAFYLGEISGVNGYDFNSLYPYVMREYAYPHPNYLRGPTTHFPSDVIEVYEGVAEVEVEVPDMLYPPLPFRYDGKLYFPTGRFRGYWTHAELRHAMTCGVKVRKVYRSLYSRRTCRPFREYVDTLYALRLKYKEEGNPQQAVVKVLMNGLYGKFGQRLTGGCERLISQGEWVEQGMPEGAIPVFYNGNVFFRVGVYSDSQPDYINVLWAAYVSAYARVELHKAIVNCPGRVFYCDTDSIYTDAVLPVSPGLGKLKLEHEGIRLTLYGPKLYRIEEPDGRIYTKAKGVPRKVQASFLTEGECRYVKPLGFLEAAVRRALPSEWVEVEKVMRNQDKKRRYDGTTPPKGRAIPSAPLRIEELV